MLNVPVFGAISPPLMHAVLKPIPRKFDSIPGPKDGMFPCHQLKI